MVRDEQEREHQKRLKQLRERAIQQKRALRRKKFIEAAYDGNLQDLEFLIAEFETELNEIGTEDDHRPKLDEAKKKQALHGLIDCRDSNNNSALSEAAAGGSAHVCKFLLSKNADPNSRGAFRRTPLWRSAFQGHLNCVQVLLENGADPRLFTDDGQSPADCATQAPVLDLLKAWNIQLTERMLQQIDKTRSALKQEQISSLQARKRGAKAEFEKVNSVYEQAKVELVKCNCELQRLHDEFNLNVVMYGELIEKKEADKVQLQLRNEELREKSVRARIEFKEVMSSLNKEKRLLKKSKTGLELNEEEGEDSQESDSDGDEFDEEKFMKINIKELEDVILRDLGGAVRNCEDRWPLIIDCNDQAVTYLRYRDTNFVNCLDMQQMKAEVVRRALLGAIRYGKPFVVDVMQYDQELFQAMRSVFEQIDARLFDELLNKSILKGEGFLRLVKPEIDGKEYEIQNFSELRLRNFKVLFMTSNPYPCDEVLRVTMPVKIITSTANKNIDMLDIF